MVKCTFCGTIIEQGTGKLYVKTDGKLFYFCSKKCEKNQFKLKRKARTTTWTEEAAKVKAVRIGQKSDTTPKAAPKTEAKSTPKIEKGEKQ